MAANKDEIKALIGKGSVGKSRFKWVFERGIPELVEAYKNRQISLHRADIIAHLTPENQREELKKLVAGKEKVIVLPATEELLMKRKERMKVDAGFEWEFQLYWRRLRRRYPGYSDGEAWRLAESIIIRLSDPELKQNTS